MKYFLILFFAGAASLVASAQDFKTFMLGSAVPATPTQRTIIINADTEWVNVKEDEVVKFVARGVEFAWKFDGPMYRPFDLQQIAPNGALTKSVTVYVARAPQW